MKKLLLALSLACLAIGFGPTRPCRAQNVQFTLDNNGLSAFSYKGQSLLAGVDDGDADAYALTFRRTDGTTYTGGGGFVSSTLNTSTATVTRTFGRCIIECTYTRTTTDRLQVQTKLTNRTSDQMIFGLQLAQLTFPTAPRGQAIEAGMFGNGGNLELLSSLPREANPISTAPALLVDYSSNALVWTSESATQGNVLSLPFTSNTGRTVPFRISVVPIGANSTLTFTNTFRFGPTGSNFSSLASDTLSAYRTANPYQLSWSDRRTIGAYFLSGAGSTNPLNPRGWFNLAGDVDVTTESGKAAFRSRLLARADNGINILNIMNAQGMIAWDIEGQEWPHATSYIGDPRKVGTFAPEMEWRPDSTSLATIDAYFKKFTDVGFKIGVCIRPQEIVFVNGVPQQNESSDVQATLNAKITYARNRWGCKLFYVDSSTSFDQPINPNVYKNLRAAFPDCLLMPENESARAFAYTAPLNSYVHDVLETPPVIRQLYPTAWSVLLPQGLSSVYSDPAKRARLVQAVRNGDVIICEGDGSNANLEIISIYNEANSSATTLFTNQTPAGFGNDAQYELGTKFSVSSARKISKVRIYTNSSEGGLHKVRIWNANGTLLSGPHDWTFSSGTAGWKEFTLPSQVSLSTGITYIVAVSTSTDKNYAFSSGFFNSALTNGVVTAPVGAGVYSTTLGQMPTNISNNASYFRDVTLVP